MQILLDKVVSLIAPHKCVVCLIEGTSLHIDCSVGLPAYAPQCFKCGAYNNDFASCKACIKPHEPKVVYVCSSLKTTSKELIKRYKFGQALAAGSDIATQIVDVLPGYLPGFVVVPVPTSGKHTRSRGFDHSALLASHVAKQMNMPYAQLLEKLGSKTQVGSSRAERLKQLKGTILALPNKDIPLKVLLIDDVSTTGATLVECTRLLKQAGVKHVYAAVFARSMR